MSTTFAPLDVDEEDVLAFNFAQSLRDGESLTSATVTVELKCGPDADPQQVKIGDPEIDHDLALVMQRVKPRAANVTYHFRCKAILAPDARPVVLSGDLEIVRR